MSRIENKKFTIHLESMDIRAAVNEVAEIMSFQISSKGLKLEIKVNLSVPQRILCDVKRYKQILFNLLGNAIKFTYTGKITVNLGFDRSTQILLTEIHDTGIGIKRSDLLRLFRFFGTI